jgi:hypothetical protein
VRSKMMKEKKMQVKGKIDNEGEKNEWTFNTKKKEPQHQKMREDGHQHAKDKKKVLHLECEMCFRA